MRNDICTSTFWQLLKQLYLWYSYMFSFSLFFFLSPLFLSNKKRKEMVVTRIVQNWLYKYHSFFFFFIEGWLSIFFKREGGPSILIFLNKGRTFHIVVIYFIILIFILTYWFFFSYPIKHKNQRSYTKSI